MHDHGIPAVTVQNAMSEAEKALISITIQYNRQKIKFSHPTHNLSSSSLTDSVERSLDYFCSTPL